MELYLEGLYKAYGKKHALRGITCRLSPGVYALLGPNGAGKSTLTRILVQRQRADRGTVWADGRNVQALGAAWRAQVGYMPQQQPLPPYDTAERFLYYMAALKGLTRTQAHEQVEHALHVTNLWENRREKLGALSGGMKQRALIAQAILGDPSLLVLDEPTAGLDPRERIRIRNLISRLGAGRIVLIATHIVSDIECIADRLLFLRKGELVAALSPQEVEKQLEGKVKEWIVPSGEADKLLDDFRVSGLIQEKNGVRVRMVGDCISAPGAQTVSPHLEDLYLYLYGRDA